MSFEKSVKGATKVKNAPPKTKYIEHILIATHSGEAGVGEIFRALQHRLRDSVWTVVFKSLITVHLMIREGAPNVTLAYLANHRSLLSVSNFTDAQTQGRNIRHYATYLAERTKAYKDTKVDWARAKESRLETLSVSKGLLRETEVVQHQLTALLKCDIMDDGADNEITIFVFRLLVLDLLALFHVLNQGLINVLRHFFEMSKPDAERAMEIYRVFIKQTDYVVQYLAIARQFSHHTRVEVPKLKHAPVNLGRQLEDYLKDPDFEINRRQFLAELEAKKANKPSQSTETSLNTTTTKSATTATAQKLSNGTEPTSSDSQNNPTGPDLIDLIFDSIEQQPPPQAQPAAPQGNGTNIYGAPQPFQQALTGYSQPQSPPNGFIPQQQMAFGFQGQPQAYAQQQMTPQQQQPFTTGGYGGFGGQQQQGRHPATLGTIPQDSIPSFQTGGSFGSMQQHPQQTMLQPQATGTNPFRQSALPPQNTGLAVNSQQTGNRLSTNPFARAMPTGGAQPQPSAFTSNSPFQSAGASRPTTAPGHLQPMPTGTNPFMRGFGQTQQQLSQDPAQPPQTANPGLVPQATGTNPFRQVFGGGGGGGGGWGQGSALDTLETVPVFPRTDGQPVQGQAMWQ